MADPDEPLRHEATESLQRIQGFDVGSLVREDELGSMSSFAGAVDPAKRLVDLFRRLSTAALEDLPAPALTQVRDKANEVFNHFNQILQFNPEQANAHQVRTNLITAVGNAYAPVFQVIHPYIAYSLHRSADFQRLESDARATLQLIKDHADKITRDLEARRTDANTVLAEIRSVAAEHGVTQQAIHFRDEAQAHQQQADEWRKKTIKLAWLLAGYAVLTFFIHKIPFLVPRSTYDTVQLGVSKVLIFAVVSYVLYLSAKNFLSHQHNAIVNRHRQNALVTYRAIVEAAGDIPNRQAVLMHAAACIFSPQATGYAGDGASQAPSAKSVIELFAKPVIGGDE
jgi:hypothetical protein